MSFYFGFEDVSGNDSWDMCKELGKHFWGFVDMILKCGDKR